MFSLLLREALLLQRLLRFRQHLQDERILRPLVKVAPGVVCERLDDLPEDGHVQERSHVALRFDVRREDALLKLARADLQRG